MINFISQANTNILLKFLKMNQALNIRFLCNHNLVVPPQAHIQDEDAKPTEPQVTSDLSPEIDTSESQILPKPSLRTKLSESLRSKI